MKDIETQFEFPCDYPVKAMGRCDAEIENIVFMIVSQHASNVDETQIKTRLSSNGKFSSVTITITAISREQLDNIYQDLTKHPDILYAL